MRSSEICFNERKTGSDLGKLGRGNALEALVKLHIHSQLAVLPPVRRPGARAREDLVRRERRLEELAPGIDLHVRCAGGAARAKKRDADNPHAVGGLRGRRYGELSRGRRGGEAEEECKSGWDEHCKGGSLMLVRSVSGMGRRLLLMGQEKKKKSWEAL